MGGVLSDRYPLRQGVRQGGVLSMKLYALYVAGLLKSLNEANLGCVIYDKFVGTASYANDITLAAVLPRSLQKMIHIADQYACQWRYTFNPRKSEVIIFGKQPKCQPHLQLGGETQLVQKDLSYRCRLIPQALDARMSKGRRSLYAMCGINASSSFPMPIVFSKLYWAVVVPTVIYRCEVIAFSDSDKDKLEIFHRFVAKHIQGLSEKLQT